MADAQPLMDVDMEESPAPTDSPTGAVVSPAADTSSATERSPAAADISPAMMSHVNMMMWMHNMYLSMMHRRFALEAQKQTRRPSPANCPSAA